MKSSIGTGAPKNHSSRNRSFAFSTTVSFFVSFLTKKIFYEKNPVTSTNILGVSMLVQPVETRFNPSRPVETRLNLSKHVSIRSD